MRGEMRPPGKPCKDSTLTSSRMYKTITTTSVLVPLSRLAGVGNFCSNSRIFNTLKDVFHFSPMWQDLVRDVPCSSEALIPYVMFYAFWYHLCNFKNVKNTHGGVLLLVKLQPNKSNTPPWVFPTFLKLSKW